MFAPPVRSVFLRALVVMAMGLGLAACDETEIPSAPDESPEFTVFLFDDATALPAPDGSIPSGAGQLQYRQRVVYQISDRDFAQESQTPVVLWLETSNENGWQGDLVFDYAFTSGQIGSMAIEGTFNMPNIGPFCSHMTGLNTFSFVWTQSEDVNSIALDAVPRDANFSNKSGFSEQIQFLTRSVSGSPTLTEPCAIAMEGVNEAGEWWLSSGDFSLAWGQPVQLWGQRLRESEVPSIFFSGGIDQDTDEVEGITVPALNVNTEGWNDWDLVLSWVPAGAQPGQIQVFYPDEAGNLVETDYGAELAPFVNVEVEQDFFEPNDTWVDPSQDVIRWCCGWFIFNPGVAISETDLDFNAEGNPFGFEEGWGQGDWWAVDVPEQTEARDICFFIFMEADDSGQFDDQDLFLTREDGSLISYDITEGTDYAFVWGSTLGNERLLLWVAPWVSGIVSENRGYQLNAYDCGPSASPTRTALRSQSPSTEKLQLTQDAGIPAHSMADRAPAFLESLAASVRPHDVASLLRGLQQTGVAAPRVSMTGAGTIPADQDLRASLQRARNYSALFRRSAGDGTGAGEPRRR